MDSEGQSFRNQIITSSSKMIRGQRWIKGRRGGGAEERNYIVSN